ncbi:MAG: hypothetical protein WKG07_26400 [Hymenobacter sp.]
MKVTDHLAQRQRAKRLFSFEVLPPSQRARTSTRYSRTSSP